MSTSVPPPGFTSPGGPSGSPGGSSGPAPDPAHPPAATPAPKLLPRWRLGAAAVAAVAAAAVGVVLIGSGGGGGLSGPIAQAATISSNTAGYRMHLSLVMSSPVSSVPITATGSGVVDLRDHASSMSLAMDFGNDPQVTQALGGRTMRMRMVMSGGTVYMKMPALPGLAQLTSDKPWLKLKLSKLAGLPGLSSLESNPTTSDPSQMLQYLRATSDVVLDEGHETVDGFRTTHYQAEVNLSDLLSKLGGSAQQAASKLKQLLPSGDLPIDVWIDSAHLVRRIAMHLDVGTAAASSVRETVTADLGHYGPQPQPTLPPVAQVQDLSGLASSLGG